MKKGKFIVFEGIDGSGKSTLINMLKEKLNKLKILTYQTYEPTDSPFGSLIHQFMIGRIETDHRTIAAMFVADRIDHLTNSSNGILNYIDKGETVISDRYYFSSYAYHSVFTDMDWVIKANQICSDILKPDVNIFIDTNPEQCMNRLEEGRKHKEKYEELNHLKKVRGQYLISFEKLKNSENVVVIDGNHSVEETFKNVWESISHHFI